MSFPPLPSPRRRHGVALVIVLAFVVLLTGLIVAFFSRALAERQISDSSASETRVDVFAAGAVNVVLGDFRQEIASGSVQSNPATGVYVYTPSAAAAAVPCLAGTTLGDGLPNLVKRSAYQQPFYSGSAYSATFPANSRAANSASTTAALNGRAVSPARWNRPLLLPKKTPGSDTDPTPANAQGGYTAPDWIVVARDGTNPTAWNTALAVNGTNPAVGRFAYNVYNEGGLLDANAAGFPAVSSTGAPVANSPNNLPLYKGSLAFADLKQLPGISDLPAARQEEVIRTLLGWRNFASTGIDPTQAAPAAGAPVSGSVNVLPGYQWTGVNISNFLLTMQANGAGFLHTANPVLVQGQSGQPQSDRLFGSRQQLLSLLLQSIADQGTGATTERANLQNAMQYLGTFSRGLNQPSFTPPAGRPKVLGAAAGGNAEGFGNDDTVNPPFLKIRVPNSVAGGSGQGRNDGSDLIAGEPLVKKRFALSRLAWLTYKGPSQQRTASDPDMVDLRMNFGYTQAFLNQGTTENIQKYFGLTWTGSYWTFGNHANASGVIRTLDDVATLNREPDFIELLKAAITAGALGKYCGYSGSGTSGVQYIRDSSIDCQVIQLTANIIDQFDVDGFPTRIQFPAYAREFRGVENLPYFYRTRNALYRIVNPTPMPADPNTDQYTIPAGTNLRSGTFLMVQQPEIWNPHAFAYDATNDAVGKRSLGYPRPTKLQLVVYGGAPSLPTPQVGGSNSVFPRWRGNNIGNASLGNGLSSNTTAMTFVNAPTLYREPTLLIKPGVPNGSQLAAPGFVQAALNDGLSPAGGGIAVLDSGAQAYTLNNGSEPAPVGVYCGIYLGKNAVAVLDNDQVTVRVAGQANFVAPSSLTYQVQCESANVPNQMDAYDEKYFAPEPYTDGLQYSHGMLATSATDANSYNGRLVMGLSRLMTGFDPRTSRFNVMSSITGEDTFFQEREFAIPGVRSPGATKWVDRNNNVVATNRMDASAGFGMWNMGSPTSPTNPTAATGWVWDGEMLRLGLFSQNNPAVSNDLLRFSPGDNTSRKGTAAAQYYADADGVVRRAMAAYVVPGTGTPAGNARTGLPMATAYYAPLTDTTQTVDPRQSESRPIVLNRPFRSVGELGYVFSDAPWKNIDLSTPQSGYAPLLDVFCINDTDDASGMTAGKVDLNTRQKPVLQAVLSGAYRDENNGAATPLSATEAKTLASSLFDRTTSTASNKGPLTSLADLVGGWKSGSGVTAVYDGFAADTGSTDAYANNITRYRESAVRALAAPGNTRVWNLLIDLVAQTGRYPQSASGLDKFTVEGEQRYWVHVAIDRYTGQVIDKQVEVVKE